MKYDHGSLNTQLQKITTEVHPQMPHNALSYALFILNFLNMDVHEQFAAARFWHDGTKTTFAKERWRDPYSGLWKEPVPVLIMGWESVCVFSQDDNQVRWLPEHMVWYVQQRNVSPDDVAVADDFIEKVKKRFLNSWSSLPHTTLLQAGNRNLNQCFWITISSWEGKEGCSDDDS